MGQHSAFVSEGQSLLLDIFHAYRSFMTSAVSTGRGTAGGLFVLITDLEAPQPAHPRAVTRSLAARIAGAATLLVCAEEPAAKAAVRSGASDFLVSGVTGLDEALRILKNELRRGSGVGVCLHASPEATIEACVERGVQPDLLGFAEPRLLARGAALVTWSTQLSDCQSMLCWSVPSGPLAVVAALDAIATTLVAESDPLSRCWLQAAPPMLGRARQRIRILPMGTANIETFVRGAQAIAIANKLALHVKEGKQFLRVDLV
jgi:hypothetical protein